MLKFDDYVLTNSFDWKLNNVIFILISVYFLIFFIQSIIIFNFQILYLRPLYG